ncbi:hypothetical protein LSAT2_017616 [Lamellibrachia satsuma]|nr:hypothetical protein LSAT2_017616 [Lamellibrachia satsuma]
MVLSPVRRDLSIPRMRRLLLADETNQWSNGHDGGPATCCGGEEHDKTRKASKLFTTSTAIILPLDPARPGRENEADAAQLSLFKLQFTLRPYSPRHPRSFILRSPVAMNKLRSSRQKRKPAIVRVVRGSLHTERSRTAAGLASVALRRMATLQLTLLLSLCIVAMRTTTGEDTTRAITCEEEFKFETQNDIFRGTCYPVPYNDGGNQYYAVPDQCSFYYRRDNRKILKCRAGPGIAFDIAQNALIGKFYANCTCPNGFHPTTMSITTTTPTTTMTTTAAATTMTTAAVTTMTTAATTTTKKPKLDKSTGGSSNTGLIAGVVVALLFIVFGVIGIVLFFRKRNNDR